MRITTAEGCLDILSNPDSRAHAPVMLVVAHPDDEVIGLGSQLPRLAPETVLVHVTDGSPRDGRDARAAGFADPDDYAAARQRELDAALSLMPRPFGARVRLGLRDQHVPRDLVRLVTRLRQLVIDFKPRLIVTHAYEGGHPDHDAIAFAVRTLVAGSHAQGLSAAEFAGYHEGSCGELVVQRFGGRATGDGRERLLSEPDERALKREMLACFVTQRRVLACFTGCEEWVRPAARCNFEVAPNGGRVWYDRLPLGMRSAEWRELVAKAARELGTNMPC